MWRQKVRRGLASYVWEQTRLLSCTSTSSFLKGTAESCVQTVSLESDRICDVGVDSGSCDTTFGCGNKTRFSLLFSEKAFRFGIASHADASSLLSTLCHRCFGYANQSRTEAKLLPMCLCLVAFLALESRAYVDGGIDDSQIKLHKILECLESIEQKTDLQRIYIPSRHLRLIGQLDEGACGQIWIGELRDGANVETVKTLLNGKRSRQNRQSARRSLSRLCPKTLSITKPWQN